jgi:hypothetical protein
MTRQSINEPVVPIVNCHITITGQHMNETVVTAINVFLYSVGSSSKSMN